MYSVDPDIQYDHTLSTTYTLNTKANTMESRQKAIKETKQTPSALLIGMNYKEVFSRFTQAFSRYS